MTSWNQRSHGWSRPAHVLWWEKSAGCDQFFWSNFQSSLKRTGSSCRSRWRVSLPNTSVGPVKLIWSIFRSVCDAHHDRWLFKKNGIRPITIAGYFEQHCMEPMLQNYPNSNSWIHEYNNAWKSNTTMYLLLTVTSYTHSVCCHIFKHTAPTLKSHPHRPNQRE